MAIPTLTQIPQEIISEIVHHLTPESRLALCLSGRIFKDPCVRAIYRCIYLSGWKSIVLCCRTLVGNGDAARAVRSISFDVVRRETSLLSSFLTLYHTALHCISPAVVNLEIMSHTPTLEPTPEHTFPALQSLTTTLPLSPSLTNFLSKRPLLQELILFGDFSAPPPPLPLPSLTSFVGLADVARVIVPNSPVLHIGIAWAHPNQLTKDCSELAMALKESTVDVISLIWFSPVFDVGLIPSLAVHLSQLEHLHFAGMLPLIGRSDDDFYTSLTTHIHLFPSLQLIDVRSRSPFPFATITTASLEAEYTIITAWSDRCPSLEVCTMPSRTFWYRLKVSGVWIPVVCPDAAVAGVWLASKVRVKGGRRRLSTVYTSSSSSTSSSSYPPTQYQTDEEVHESQLEEESRQEQQREEDEVESNSELQQYMAYIHNREHVTSESLGAFFRQSWRRRQSMARRRGVFELPMV